MIATTANMAAAAIDRATFSCAAAITWAAMAMSAVVSSQA